MKKLCIFCFVSILFAGCSLFDSGGNSKTAKYGTAGSSDSSDVAADLTGSTCTANSECSANEYCDMDNTPYKCEAQPCMENTDCPQDDPTWGAMICYTDASPHRCVSDNSDQCVQTNNGGQLSSNCGNSQFCDVNHGHPYTCKPQPCTGDAVCQKCDSGMTCTTTGGYQINSRPNQSTYKYVCDLSVYTHICKTIEVSPPPAGGCTSNADCTASANGHVCLPGTAPRACGCNAPVNCPSGQFCRQTTKRCQAPSANECTTDANCDSLYFGIDQYFCDDRAPNSCRERVSGTGTSAHCWRHSQCYTEWCYYSSNADPTAEPPSPEVGYCRAKDGNGFLGLDVGENCTNSNQCTKRSGLICGSDNKCRGQIGIACSATDLCGTGLTCTDNICKGNNGTPGCNNTNSLCVSNICRNQTKAATPGYYCVGGLKAPCTTTALPSLTPHPDSYVYNDPRWILYNVEGASTECIYGVCTSGSCGLSAGGRCGGTFSHEASGAWCKNNLGCNHNTSLFPYWFCK
ncbi:MAG: hypothetical protein WCQ53_04890 [bacterium]